MAIPTTRAEFKDHCKRRLGWPVLELNVDEDQLEDRIDEALDEYQEFHYAGTERTYLKHQITQTDVTNEYISITENVQQIVRILPIGDTSVGGGIFDLRYQLRLNELWDFSSTSYMHYVTVKTHLEQLQMIFTGHENIRYKRHKDRLYIDWDWDDDVAIGEYIIIEAYIVIDPETFTDVWSDHWLQQYATALFKRQWGVNLSKYQNVTLPGGVIFNGGDLYGQALDEIAQLKEELKNTYSEFPHFIIA